MAMFLKVAIIGLGYVGLPLAALLAERLDVIGFDIDASRIKKLEAGEPVLSEPGLDEALSKAVGSGRLRFSPNPADVSDSDVKIITVGTPYDERAKDVDYSFLDSAIEIVCGNIKKGDVVALKSTVPVGTTSERLVKALRAKGYAVPEDVGVVFSPERMVEGQAIRDFKTLPNIVGASDERSLSIYSEVASVMGGRIIRVSNPETAEMVKMTDNYARFAFLGITNELALMCEKAGVDVLEMLKAAKEDYARNAGLMIPGPGVGGSCLNKDPFILKANMAKKGLELKIVDAAKEVNYHMPTHVYLMVKEFRNNAKEVAIAGVAFKGETDDTRFAPSLKINEMLKADGATVRLSDPYVRSVSGTTRDIYEAVKGAEVLLIMTDHKAYGEMDLKRVKSLMAQNPLIIDTRGIIKRDEAERLGFEYHGLGRL